MAKVYNKSKQRTEQASKRVCPMCKGFGATFMYYNRCRLCDSKGELWISVEDTGWCRAIGRQLEDSLLYWVRDT